MNDLQLFLVQSNFSELTEEQFQSALIQVDQSNQQRARRFFHREDAWRFLLGRLLRHRIVSRIVNAGASDPVPLVFKETTAGKPYLDSPVPPYIGFNISHDSSAILLAVRSANDISLSSDIGVDVMKVQIPSGETFYSFLESLSCQEKQCITRLHLDPPSPGAALYTLYQIWTIKESYVKALGIGLGFNISRIEYDPQKSAVSVDGKPLSGWRIDSFSFGGIESIESHGFVGSVCYRMYEKGDTPQGHREQNVFVHPKLPPGLQLLHPSILLDSGRER